MKTTTYIALLRGINVGGHRIIPMKTLRQLCQELGFDEVQTYIQSGNIIFNAEKTENFKLEIQLASAIRQQFGFEVPVVMLTAAELKLIVEKNPFLSEGNAYISHLAVTILAGVPETALAGKLSHVAFAPDRFEIVDRQVYLNIPGSYHKSKLTNQFFESGLQTTATTRNWKTMVKLTEISQVLEKTFFS